MYPELHKCNSRESTFLEFCVDGINLFDENNFIDSLGPGRDSNPDPSALKPSECTTTPSTFKMCPLDIIFEQTLVFQHCNIKSIFALSKMSRYFCIHCWKGLSKYVLIFILRDHPLTTLIVNFVDRQLDSAISQITWKINLLNWIELKIHDSKKNVAMIARYRCL
jgi:hypothetical protein